MKNIDAVIFDLDGTIVDSFYIWEKIDIEFFNKRGMPVPTDYFEKINSMSFLETATFTKNEYNLKETIEEIMQEWYDKAVYEYANNIKLKAGVKDYINLLKQNNIKIALATASPRDFYEPVLKNNNIYHYFDAFVSGNEVSRSKEFPDIYLLAAKKINIEPSRCLVFEDIFKGIKGAKSAGMTAYGIYEEHSSTDTENIIAYADGYIKTFKELLP